MSCKVCGYSGCTIPSHFPLPPSAPDAPWRQSDIDRLANAIAVAVADELERREEARRVERAKEAMRDFAEVHRREEAKRAMGHPCACEHQRCWHLEECGRCELCSCALYRDAQ